MESDNAVFGAILFILMVLLANFVMYGIVRGWTRSDKKGFWEAIGKSLNSSTRRKDDSMDELHRRVDELEKGKKEETGDSD